MQVTRFNCDHEELERLLREHEREHRRRADLERLEKLRRSLLVPQHGAFRHPRAQPNLNVWVGPRDMFRVPQRRKAQPPASWITEKMNERVKPTEERWLSTSVPIKDMPAICEELLAGGSRNAIGRRYSVSGRVDLTVRDHLAADAWRTSRARDHTQSTQPTEV